MKTSKRLKKAKADVLAKKVYPLPEAIDVVKKTSSVKFDASVEAHVNLGIDPKKSDQLIRGSVTLPHGTGKSIRIAAFVSDEAKDKAIAAGAEVVGSDELIAEIKKTGKCDFDVAVATPEMMKKLAAIARILGQKGLMPNPKTGTITKDVATTISELKTGKVSYRNDLGGALHITCGKVSFDSGKLIENISVLLESVKKNKPESLKGTFIKSIYLTSSMGPSVRLSI